MSILVTSIADMVSKVSVLEMILEQAYQSDMVSLRYPRPCFFIRQELRSLSRDFIYK